MLTIRLSRMGKKKQPTYRIVVQEKARDPWGKSVEIVGNYNPRNKPDAVTFKEDRVKYWLERGAQPSPTVHNLLVDAKVIEGKKLKATTKDFKAPEPKEEDKPTEQAAATEGEAPKEEGGETASEAPAEGSEEKAEA